MEQGDELGGGLEAAEAARAEAEAAAEAASGPGSDAGRLGLIGGSEQAGTDEMTPAGGADGEPGTPVCPFLRLERHAALSAAADTVDVDHRCTALGTPVPVSEAQQSLVCLVATHVDCPRYLRGSNLVPVAEPPSRREIPRPTLAAAAVLALSLAGTLAFTAANGGLAIPTAPSTPAPSEAIAGSPAVATPASSPVPSRAASPSTAPSTSNPGSASPSAPTPSAAGSPGATPAASPASSGATADRLALLQPCPGRTDCYIYVVRAGDNLTSIGLFFGVPFDTLLRLNPWISDPTTIHKGERIILTTPTR